MKAPRTAEKVLYLDYDGVLHHEAVYFHPKQGIYMGAVGRQLFEWMPILEELLAPHPDVAIVLSTSWVRVKRFAFAKKQLSAQLQARVIGATFHHGEMRKDEFVFLSRGQQIANDVSRRGPKSWFAIDDDDFGWPDWCRENLIKTDGSRGISQAEVQRKISARLVYL